MNSQIRKIGGAQDKVTVTTRTSTIHNVHVDLKDVLSQFDVTDGQVVLILEMPNGRAKRVAISQSMLVPPVWGDR